VAAPLRLLADMNISPLTGAALDQAGWDILRVSDRLSKFATDPENLAYARQEGRVIVTQDLDFSALVALSGYSRPSLITLRLPTTDPTAVTARLLQILPQIQAQLEQGCAVTVDERTLRVRYLPIR
jgi:predicted nuclease of predicted toxin-antitoxin system